MIFAGILPFLPALNCHKSLIFQWFNLAKLHIPFQGRAKVNDQSKKPAAAKPVAAPKPPKKLVPRTAPKAEVQPAAADTPAPEAPLATSVATAAAAVKAKPVRKPTKVQETVAKHQKVLADALVKAQAIKYDQPKVMKQEAPAAKKSAKPEKPPKAKKIKLVRDSYAMPEAEYARIGELKKRLAALGAEVKKSELLRGGIAVLAALNDAELKAVMGRIERIKTGRPSK
jgi:polyhydroxyalkanoate synthesis regulator phasin